MSELRQQLWAVMSERGCEANNLNYDEAVEIVRRLTAEKVHGMCIITNDAAHLLSRTEPFKSSTPNSNGSRKARRKGERETRRVGDAETRR